MLFKVISFHPAADGSVNPRAPTFIEASTWYNARRVLAGALSIPVDELNLELFDGELPSGAHLYSERDNAKTMRKVGRMPVTHGSSSPAV